jgi:hypothetical protein
MTPRHRTRHIADCLIALGIAFGAAACTGKIVSASGKSGPHAHAAARSAGSGGATASDDGAGAGGDSTGSTGGANGGQGIDASNCDVASAGSTPLQRLTRDEYAHSVRDLLGLSEVNVDGIAQDERVGPFAANDVAPVSDLIIEQYMTAAETFTRQAGDGLEKLVTCDRAKLGDDACAAQFITEFGLRVYRRPLANEEVTAYTTLFTSYASGGYADALRVIVQTMLQSPFFLYRVELVPAAPAKGAALVDLDAYELATRLSFFLLRTTPDAALLGAAGAGKLTTEAELSAQVRGMLDDPRAAEMLSAFHMQWLELEDLPHTSKDPAAYPAFDADLASAMQHETERFVDYVVRKGDAKLETLLSAPYSLLEGPLYDLYGVEAAASADADMPVQLDVHQRAGLLTQASFLAVHGHANQSAPVQRGKVVIRNVLCEQLPDPPPNVNTTPPEPSPDATTRQRFAEHEKDPVCGGCHVRIDGIGMGFENYDGIGAFRTRDGKQAVDASGKLIDTQDLDGSFDGAVDLAKKLARSQEVSDCVATQWLRFALGRLEADADTCSVNAIQRAFDASGHDVRALLEAIVVSDAFRKKALPEVSP